MLFNSLSFAAFFPIVTALYFLFPSRFRWILLLAASSYFYMAFVPVYILILGFTIVIDYAAGILIAGSEGRRRRLLLAASLLANIGVLAVFKYFNFFADSFNAAFAAMGGRFAIPGLSLLLPIGLSFHTFQAMSYTIEVYRGRQPPERHFGIYALYVMFYPQLVAGPIERPQNLLHQFREVHTFDIERVRRGLTLMAWGLMKKIVIADRLAPFVSRAYQNPDEFSGAPLILATVCFAFQIYCDFSGYSDMALGSAEVMGFRLMRNFSSPYLATSLGEFWRRWHISLSTWFRDYVFLPLSYRLSRSIRPGAWLGLRRDVWAYGGATLTTMFLCGIWHGAAWTFVLWGLLHGFYLAFGFATRRFREGVVKSTAAWLPFGAVTVVRTVVTFLLVCVAWVFFRAPTIDVALRILSLSVARLIPSLVSVIVGQTPAAHLFIDDPASLALIGLFMWTVMWVERREPHQDARTWLSAQTPLVRWGVYSAILLSVLLLGQFEQEQPFIYFQF